MQRGPACTPDRRERDESSTPLPQPRCAYLCESPNSNGCLQLAHDHDNIHTPLRCPEPVPRMNAETPLGAPDTTFHQPPHTPDVSQRAACTAAVAFTPKKQTPKKQTPKRGTPKDSGSVTQHRRTLYNSPMSKGAIGEKQQPTKLCSTEWMAGRTPPHPSGGAKHLERQHVPPHQTRKADRKYKYVKSFVPVPATPEKPGAAIEHFSRGIGAAVQNGLSVPAPPTLPSSTAASIPAEVQQPLFPTRVCIEEMAVTAEPTPSLPSPLSPSWLPDGVVMGTILDCALLPSPLPRRTSPTNAHCGEADTTSSYPRKTPSTAVGSEVRGESSSNGFTESRQRHSLSMGNTTPTSLAAVADWNDGLVDVKQICLTPFTSPGRPRGQQETCGEDGGDCAETILPASPAVAPEVGAHWRAKLDKLLAASLRAREEMLAEYRCAIVTGAVQLYHAPARRPQPEQLPPPPPPLLGSLTRKTVAAPRSSGVVGSLAANRCAPAVDAIATDESASAPPLEAAAPPSPLPTLLHAFCGEADDTGCEALLHAYFATLFQHHVNQTLHAAFDNLYLNMVAIPALMMIETQARRLVCMRRDLYIRDKIELYMLTVPTAPPTATPVGEAFLAPFRSAFMTLGKRPPLASAPATATHRGGRANSGGTTIRMRPKQQWVRVTSNPAPAARGGRGVAQNPGRCTTTYSRLHRDNRSRPRPQGASASRVLPNIRRPSVVMRAKEHIRTKPRRRTPPRTPTEDDFVNLAEVHKSLRMSLPEKHGRVPEILNSRGTSILTNRYLNRGTAFTHEQRKHLHIIGRLPPTVETLEEQVERAWAQLLRFEKPINRYNHLAQIHSTNTTLFYAIVLAHIKEVLPIIYTPTVGEACQSFSNYYVRERGLYVHKHIKGMLDKALVESMFTDVEVIVITDGSRILGLGDLGVNGVGISLGKCSLYVAGAGLHPMRVLPVVMDTGTNTERLLNDEEYLGSREKRLNDDEFYSLLDEFMESVAKVWPGAVVQFEDFSNNHCFDMLERYQKKYRCFNDDIQGTGAVIAAGFMNAVKLSGKPPLDQRIVVFGAGSAAVGVAKNIAQLAARLHNVSVEDMLKSFYLVDTKGLVTTTRGDKLAKHKELLARTDVSAEDSQKLKTLEDVVKFVKPTALLGLGGVGPVFTEEIVKGTLENCEHPIIFPLSNPTSKSECAPDDAYKWTNGTAIVASGSPFPPTVLNGKTLVPSQGNNLYVFPGIGLGCSLCKPTYIPDDLLIAASACLNALTTVEQLAEGQLYPPLDDIHNISAHIAADVILEAQRLGIDTEKSLPRERAALIAEVKKHQWVPHYPKELDIKLLN